MRKGTAVAGSFLTATAYCTANPTLCVMDATAAAATGCAVASNTDDFIACAGADLGAAVNDAWSINQGKALTQTSVGD